MTELQNFLADLYLEFMNDYLTVEVMAEHKEVSVEVMASMLGYGKECQELRAHLHRLKESNNA